MTARVLTLIEDDYERYYIDNHGLKQGEYKRWARNGKLIEHCWMKDHNFHGEFKSWYDNGKKCEFAFFKNGHAIGEDMTWTTEGKVDIHEYLDQDGNTLDLRAEFDIHNLTKEDKFYIQLTYGIPFLSARFKRPL